MYEIMAEHGWVVFITESVLVSAKATKCTVNN
jgi:hypothetical protein